VNRRKLERAALILAVVFTTGGVVRLVDRGPEWLGLVLGVGAAVIVVSAVDAYRARRPH
jgi:hypothetical protein